MTAAFLKVSGHRYRRVIALESLDVPQSPTTASLVGSVLVLIRDQKTK